MTKAQNHDDTIEVIVDKTRLPIPPEPKSAKKAAYLEYEFHPLAKMFPLMEGDQYEAFKADIDENGLYHKMWRYKGKDKIFILAGRNRYRALKELGKLSDACFEDFKGNDADAEDFVIADNLHRTHYTNDDKRETAEKWLKKYPDWSDRYIGKLAKLDGKTVADVRATAEIPQSEARTGEDGVKRRRNRSSASASTAGSSKKGRRAKAKSAPETLDQVFARTAPTWENGWDDYEAFTGRADKVMATLFNPDNTRIKAAPNSLADVD